MRKRLNSKGLWSAATRRRFGEPQRPAAPGCRPWKAAPSRRTPKDSTRAFTITELLVAMAILMVISGLLLSMVNSVSNTWALSQQNAERQRAARVALDLINRDLAQAIISTNANAPIHFYGLSTAVYFIATSPSQSDAGSDMVEVGYILNRATGKLYRYYTTNGAAEWNPRDTGAANPTWRWPNIETPSTYSYNSEADTLVAEGVIDLQFVYSGPHTNSSAVWSNSVPGWVTTNNDTSASFPGGAYQTDTLPAVVDIYLTVLPISKWTNNTIPVAAYRDLTNQHSRTFQATVNITRGGF